MVEIYVRFVFYIFDGIFFVFKRFFFFLVELIFIECIRYLRYKWVSYGVCFKDFIVKWGEIIRILWF